MDRRKMLALLGVSPAIFAGSPAHALPLPGEKAAPEASSVNGDGPMTVLNPAIPGKLAERFPLVAPLDTLEGKTIYMINIQWGGPDSADSFFGAMQEWFAKNMPSVKTVLRLTSGDMFTDDPGLRKEMIAQKADAAIVGVAS
jgi:hypothetical protein